MSVTTDARTRRNLLYESAAHSVYDQLWSGFLSLLLVSFWRGEIPSNAAIDDMVDRCFHQMEDDEGFLEEFTVFANNWPGGQEEPLDSDDELLKPFQPGDNMCRTWFLERIRVEVSNSSLQYLKR